PLCGDHSLTELLLVSLPSYAASLSLETDRRCDVRGHLPQVRQRRQQRPGGVTQRRRLLGQRSSRREDHRVSDSSSAGGRQSQSDCRENVDIIALRDRNGPLPIADWYKRGTSRNEGASLRPAHQVLGRRLRSGRRIGKRKDNWTRHFARHLAYDALRK